MKKLMVLSGVVLLTACGLDRSMGTNSTASAYDRAALQVSNSVAGYQTATTNMASPADCTGALQQYAGQVSPVLDRMNDMAGEMDDMMTAGAHATDADVHCGMQVMVQEFQHHVGVACSSSDMAANQAEVQRHAQAMQQYTNHMRMRADEVNTIMPGGMMGGMMNPGGGMMGWSEPMPGCSYTATGYQPAAG